MKVDITITIDTDALQTLDDAYLACLWHVAQANPAPIQDDAAGYVAEAVGREIITRFLANSPPPLWWHQGKHASACALTDLVESQKTALGTPEVSHG